MSFEEDAVVIFARNDAGVVKARHDGGGRGQAAGEILSHDEVPFPGINGLRHGSKTNCVYYTTSSQELLMRVAVDPATHEPAGPPEFIADAPSVDDFCLDEDTGVAYLARHPDHIVERVLPKRGASGLGRATMACEPFSDKLQASPSLHRRHRHCALGQR